MADVNAVHLWFMLLSTVRYSLHRCSAAPSFAAELVLQYRPHLADEQVQQIREEIETELRLAERRGQLVGHACDHETWRRLAEQLGSCETQESRG
jgi:hypothetical protein